MKKLILLELAILFLATTFQSDNPPGWYQQQLPVNKNVTDIYFLDSLNGWISTTWGPQFDTGYILSTSNGGDNWYIQLSTVNSVLAIQFLDINFGYAVGGSGVAKVFKTTNGGVNWQILVPFGSGVNSFLDLSFVNKDTGWICTDHPFSGGIYKTTNGGGSWVRQLDQTYSPTKIFFLNKDTGWAACNMDRLYRTINGGLNWNLQFTSAFTLGTIFFLNGQKGWIRGGPDLNGNGASYSTDGGFTWTSSQGIIACGYDIKFVNDSIGYSGPPSQKIPKSTDGGRTFGYQISPIQPCLQTSFLRGDTLLGWMGSNGFIRTTDGGGTIVNINQVENEIPNNFTLRQNYPNPFNPNTIINYELRITSFVKLKIFDMQGKEIAELVNQRQSSGEYKVNFNGNGLTSGVYFYRIEILDEKSNKSFTDTKKMVLVR